MKASKLKKLAWVFFALAQTAGTVFGQGQSNGNISFNRQNGACLSSISGLTEEQQNQIRELDEKHWLQMDELRTQRRSTTNAIEKSELRTSMLKKREAHRNAVKSLLTEEQQKQFEQIHAVLADGPNQKMGHKRGNAGFHGQGCNIRNNPNFKNRQRPGRGNWGWPRNSGRGTCIYNYN